MSDQATGKIYEAIPAIMAEVGAVGKNEKNTQQGYRYRSADDVSDAVRALMGKHGVFPTKKIMEHSETERESKQGGRLMWVKLKCLWTFHAADGSSVDTESYGEGMDTGDKATNKAETGSMKNALIQVFQLMGHEDSEVDSPEPEVDRRQPNPACPTCGTNEHVIKGKEEYGGGWLCWKNRGGCGAKWHDAPKEELPDYSPGVHNEHGDQIDKAPPSGNGKKADAKKIAEQHGMTTGDKVQPPAKGMFDSLKERLSAFDASAPDAAKKLTVADDFIYKEWKERKAITDAEKHELDFMVAEIQKDIDSRKKSEPAAA